MNTLPSESNGFEVTNFWGVLKESFSQEYYLDNYPDVKKHCAHSGVDDCAWEHYCEFGLREGREISRFSNRAYLNAYLSSAEGTTLEVGPFLRPTVIGENVKYFEVLDKEALKKRAELHNYPVTHIPEIDFVHPEGDLGIVKEQFDRVVSSHCIEHQPNLIKHLNNVKALLKPGGQYFVICPDKRFCFDHFNPITQLIDVVAADLEDRKVHSAKSVLRHYTGSVHNDPLEHWLGKHGSRPTDQEKLDKARAAIDAHNHSAGGYIDVHAWMFTPDSFQGVFKELSDMGLIDLKVTAVYPTVYASNEFLVILE